eukprot:jgi/Mesen1/8478/ME000478S07971
MRGLAHLNKQKFVFQQAGRAWRPSPLWGLADATPADAFLARGEGAAKPGPPTPEKPLPVGSSSTGCYSRLAGLTHGRPAVGHVSSRHLSTLACAPSASASEAAAGSLLPPADEAICAAVRSSVASVISVGSVASVAPVDSVASVRTLAPVAPVGTAVVDASVRELREGGIYSAAGAVADAAGSASLLRKRLTAGEEMEFALSVDSTAAAPTAVPPAPSEPLPAAKLRANKGSKKIARPGSKAYVAADEESKRLVDEGSADLADSADLVALAVVTNSADLADLVVSADVTNSADSAAGLARAARSAKQADPPATSAHSAHSAQMVDAARDTSSPSGSGGGGRIGSLGSEMRPAGKLGPAGEVGPAGAAEMTLGSDGTLEGAKGVIDGDSGDDTGSVRRSSKGRTRRSASSRHVSSDTADSSSGHVSGGADELSSGYVSNGKPATKSRSSRKSRHVSEEPVHVSADGIPCKEVGGDGAAAIKVGPAARGVFDRLCGEFPEKVASADVAAVVELLLTRAQLAEEDVQAIFKTNASLFEQPAYDHMRIFDDAAAAASASPSPSAFSSSAFPSSASPSVSSSFSESPSAGSSSSSSTSVA